MKKINLISISLLIILAFIVLFILNYRLIVDILPQGIKDRVPNRIIQIHSKFAPYAGLLNFAISSDTNLNDLLYNMEFLPQTQYGKINYKTLNIQTLDGEQDLFDETKIDDSFVIDYFDNNLILSTFNGNFFKAKLVNDLDKNIKIKSIKTNLKEINSSVRVLDIHIDGDDLLVSYYSEISIKNGEKCNNVKLAKSLLDIDNLNFDVIYSSDECGSHIQAGRIQSYILNNKEGYLVTIANNKKDYPNLKAQDMDSDFGKIIFIEKNSFKKSIFSSGHRNPQGLLVVDNIILETEHGPKGGDEINLIAQGNNYGWPLSSYGVSYNIQNKYYKKSHAAYDFSEPIFSFIPSIGISEIAKLPNDFWPNSQIENLFFLTSLNARSIFQIKFDYNYDKVQLIEKIFIGQRIRDIAVIPQDKLVILALEQPGKIAIITPM